MQQKTATTFKEKIGIDGLYYQNMMVIQRWVALSIAHQVEVPLRFIGIGEKMPDLEVLFQIELFQDFWGLVILLDLLKKQLL